MVGDLGSTSTSLFHLDDLTGDGSHEDGVEDVLLRDAAVARNGGWTVALLNGKQVLRQVAVELSGPAGSELALNVSRMKAGS